MARCSACARCFPARCRFPRSNCVRCCCSSAAVVLFAVLLPLAGLAVTSFAIVICAGFAAYDVRLRENAIAALALAAFAVVLFVSALGLPIKVLAVVTGGPWT